MYLFKQNDCCLFHNKKVHGVIIKYLYHSVTGNYRVFCLFFSAVGSLFCECSSKWNDGWFVDTAMSRRFTFCSYCIVPWINGSLTPYTHFQTSCIGTYSEQNLIQQNQLYASFSTLWPETNWGLEEAHIEILLIYVEFSLKCTYFWMPQNFSFSKIKRKVNHPTKNHELFSKWREK